MEKDKKISELGKLETVTGEEVALVEKEKKNYGLPLSLLAKARDLEEVNRSIEGLQSDISDLRLQNDYGVASWSEDDWLAGQRMTLLRNVPVSLAVGSS